MNKKQVLGLIVARGGSKGIPGKNLVDLGGKPLISWVAEEARKCSILDDLILSTDDLRIREFATAEAVRSPFLRPVALAGDASLILDVILHALNWIEMHEHTVFEYVCLIQPTSPFAIAQDYEKTIELAIRENADTVITVYPCEQKHPAIMYTLDAQQKAIWFPSELGWRQMSRRQDLPPVYMRSGIAYVLKTQMLKEQKTLYGQRLYAMELPRDRAAIDINDAMDLEFARFLIEKKKISK